MRARTLPPEWDGYARQLGVRIARARRARGLTQQQVADRSGVSRGMYQRYELGRGDRGTSVNPSLLHVLAIAESLELRIDELLPAETPSLRAGA